MNKSNCYARKIILFDSAVLGILALLFVLPAVGWAIGHMSWWFVEKIYLLALLSWEALKRFGGWGHDVAVHGFNAAMYGLSSFYGFVVEQVSCFIGFMGLHFPELELTDNSYVLAKIGIGGVVVSVLIFINWGRRKFGSFGKFFKVSFDWTLGNAEFWCLGMGLVMGGMCFSALIFFGSASFSTVLFWRWGGWFVALGFGLLFCGLMGGLLSSQMAEQKLLGEEIIIFTRGSLNGQDGYFVKFVGDSDSRFVGDSDIKAQCELGDKYFLGEGIKQNINQAEYWYKRAEELGSSYAKERLGEIELKRNKLKEAS